jgi:hypothetical protein
MIFYPAVKKNKPMTKVVENRYALLNSGKRQEKATKAIEHSVAVLTGIIKKRMEELDPEEYLVEDIVRNFYHILHYYSFEIEPIGDEEIDLHIGMTVMEIHAISEKYPDAAIGDTMTDELIAYHLEESLTLSAQ